MLVDDLDIHSLFVLPTRRLYHLTRELFVWTEEWWVAAETWLIVTEGLHLVSRSWCVAKRVRYNAIEYHCTTTGYMRSTARVNIRKFWPYLNLRIVYFNFNIWAYSKNLNSSMKNVCTPVCKPACVNPNLPSSNRTPYRPRLRVRHPTTHTHNVSTLHSPFPGASCSPPTISLNVEKTGNACIVLMHDHINCFR